MALFQQWHLLNNIDENISLIQKLLDNKHNNYYYLSQNELDELFERLNEFNKFKILLKIKEDIFKEKELFHKNYIIQLKRKIKKQNNYINSIYLYLIIFIFIILSFLCKFYL